MSTTAEGIIREDTYYEVLGVSEDATSREIRRAWRSLIADCHPDRETGEEAIREATERAAAINAAYSVLTSPEERSRYDNGLYEERGGGRTASPHAEERQEDGDPEDGYFSDLSEEDEEAYWDRVQREAEEEAEAAWARWENPPARQKLAEAFAELRGFDLSGVSLLGAYDDFLDAELGLEKNSLDGSGRPKTTVVTTIMAALTVGQLAIMGSTLLGTGAPVVIALLSALALDLVLTGLGARPLVLLATKAGAGIALSEGGKLAAWIALAVRSLWAGPVAFSVAVIPVSILGAIVGLFNPAVADLIDLALMVVPPAWTVLFAVVWALGSLTGTSHQTDQDQMGGS